MEEGTNLSGSRVRLAQQRETSDDAKQPRLQGNRLPVVVKAGKKTSGRKEKGGRGFPPKL